MAEDVIQESESGVGIGYHTETKLKEWDDYDRRYVLAKVFVYLPETSEHATRFLKEGRIRAIGTVRDPRDIVTSMMGRAGSQWDFDQKVSEELPKWLAQFTKWAQLGPGLSRIVRYEDMIPNLGREVREIAKFLEIDLPEGMDFEIARRYTIKAQKERAERFRGTGERDHPYLSVIPGIVFGSAGQWQTWLSPAQAKKIEKVTEGFMKKWDYL